MPLYENPMNVEEELAKAFKAGDSKRVASLFEQHPQMKTRINEPVSGTAFGEFPLLIAVGRQDREMIDVLLHAGADINARTNWWAGGFGVLDEASTPIAQFLIERGATVDAHAAARLGMIDKIRELVTERPDVVHARGGDGQTPLHFASTIEVAEYLLAHGADIDARDTDHESTPAQYMLQKPDACRGTPDRSDVARYLVGRGCATDILMATALGEVELVRKHLVADPASVHTSVSERYFPKRDAHSGGTIYIWVFGWHRTAQQIAHELGHRDVFDLLMERSPDELKLAVACEILDEDLVNALLEKRPNLARSLSDDDSARLAYAAQNNRVETVKLMLTAGWPVNARGQHRGTALNWAAWHGNAEMVRGILRHHPAIDDEANEFKLAPLGWARHGAENGWYRGTGDFAGTIELLTQAMRSAEGS